MNINHARIGEVRFAKKAGVDELIDVDDFFTYLVDGRLVDQRSY